MTRRLNITLCLGLPLLALLIGGVFHLFSLRFTTGDIYPPYSSLRADPLGTKALLDSLASLPGVTAQGLLDPLPRLPGGGRDTTLLVLGTQPRALELMPAHDFKEVEDFMRAGGRVLIACPPMTKEPRLSDDEERDTPGEVKPKSQPKKDAKKSDAKKSDAQKAKDKKKEAEERLPEEMRRVKLSTKWAVSLAYRELPHDETGATRGIEAERVGSDAAMPATLQFHTALHFRDLGPQWRTNYQRVEQLAIPSREVGGPWRTNTVRTGLPVVIERSFGLGTLILCADSYPFSNEALRRNRQLDLITWAIGANHRVVFDETHLGVNNDPGVAALARRYRLHGFFGALLVLALLFVWKSTSPFIPPHSDADLDGRADLVEGKDSASGFVNLLRRGIPASEVLAVCFAEWKKSFSHAQSHLRPRRERMEQVLQSETARPARERQPVVAYQQISRIYKERK
ncbi:MAG: DUF4350 domain-containing protein [Verrucomicrobia bacterium]|nr:DUF4350 domain-containing protein [Verrucomicrobiota bacterium]